ncbi:zinc ABC transporter substrate-binding protein [Aquiluna sp.]|jgi:zinc/manganese transport system substrate-binding protein|nr:zinc ABC transporter substrate-binding protein [Aquiluna sp.]
MRSWIKIIGSALTVAFVAAGLYTIFVNFTTTGDPEGNPSDAPSPTLTREGQTGAIQVATSTNVWASVVEILGGEWVEVTAIISDPMQDPHSYEASARDQLTLSEAELVIANGGGYDEFVGQLVSALDGERIFLELVEGEHSHLGEEDSHDEEEHSQDEESHDHDHGNEHIWYDIHAVEEASEMIVEAITELRPESFDQVNQNFDFFMAELENLEVRLEALREKALGLGYIATEGVGNLLLEEAGFVNQTPDALADAIEEEREVPAAALKQAQDLIAGKVVSLVVVNEQQLDQVSELLVESANASGVPVVQLSELISEPEMDYLDWMASILDHLQEAIY